jgi:4-amino-4-deoxy-L-arabinose transferase-like glycosyltransferase
MASFMSATRRGKALFFAPLFAATLALRLAHSRVLWADEDYHIAAGIQALAGRTLYRDLWYDKPPLAAWLYAAMDGPSGWPLRLFDALFVLALCAVLYRFAREMWGGREGFLAAGLAAFFLNFGLPAAVIPAAPDFLMMLPHAAAGYLAWKRKPLAAGLAAGAAFLLNPKGVFVLAACALFSGGMPLLAAGFAIPCVAVFAVLSAQGALVPYIDEVWRWGMAYVSQEPLGNGVRRVVNWMGFQSLLMIGAAWFWRQEPKRGRLRLAGWTAISFAGAAAGASFWPRYFLQVLPPLAIVSARGLALLLFEGTASRRKLAAAVCACAALVPAVRFGPRYALLALDLATGRRHQWDDVALDADSRAAAALVNRMRRPGDMLFVWGYRPGIFVYTRMPAGSRFWDSQPLTGVPADRHLFDATPILPERAARNRAEVARSKPEFIVDGLGLLNPRLSMEQYPELREWLRNYRVVARTRLSVVYRRGRP